MKRSVGKQSRSRGCPKRHAHFVARILVSRFTLRASHLLCTALLAAIVGCAGTVQELVHYSILPEQRTIEHRDPAELPPALKSDLERIYSGKELSARRFSGTFLEDGKAYTVLEARVGSDEKDRKDLVRYETATGARSVLVPWEKLVPAGESKPLSIDHREINAASGQRAVISQEIRTDQRSMHHPPWKNAGVKFCRWHGPCPGAHDRERMNTSRIAHGER